MNKLLEVKNLTIRFNTDEGLIKAVDDLSFSLDAKEVLGIVGESGSGKSVMAKSIMDLNANNTVYDSKSQILFNTQKTDSSEDVIDVLKLKSEKSKQVVRGGAISMVFQEPMASFAPAITIGKQMVEQIMIHTSMNKKQALELSIEMLDRVQVSDPAKRVHQYAFELSGGMRQRAMIAMALSTHPQLLIADEPTTALDVIIQDQVLDLMREIKTDFDMAIILISHDLGVIAQMADRIGVMYLGKLVEMGNVKEIISNTAHPYTKGLIDAIPKLEALDRPLTPIPGDIPSLLERPKGCAFHNRCASVMERCRKESPKYNHRSKAHVSACWLNEENVNNEG